MARDMGLESTPKIFARFFDHAISDPEKSKKSGRKRFKPAVYLELRNLAESVPDVFHRKMIEQDKADYPEQWDQYQKNQQAISNRAPSVNAIPGMTVVAYEEFKALELWNCEKIAEYSGDLENLEPFRALAKQIMEISDGEVSKKRAMVRTAPSGQIHDNSGADRPAAIIPIKTEKESNEKKGKEESFRYSFQVSM